MKITVDSLKNAAIAISENSDIFKEGMVVKYSLPSKLHMKLNEEFHYRVMGSEEELKYTDTIEVTILGVNFEIKKDEE
jgi:hypothetical protein